MGTVIRSKISVKSENYISKHRYLELKHFCLQYNEWERKWREIPVIAENEISKIPGGKNPGKPTENLAIRRMTYERNMQIVWQCCNDADKSIADYIFEAVTEGKSFKYMENVPCGKDYFYERYRRFFKLLDSVRR